ncbi:hypothetical protein NFI96_020430, partial [Prochilodus magdalenae]
EFCDCLALDPVADTGVKMIYTVTVFIIWFAGCSSAAQDVHQTPPDQVMYEQNSTSLYCSHSLPNHDVILWYKQSEDNQLHLLGYLNMQFKYPEEALKNKIDLDGHGSNKGTLTIKTLQLNDSAVYFCAVRYTVLQTP